MKQIFLSHLCDISISFLRQFNFYLLLPAAVEMILFMVKCNEEIYSKTIIICCFCFRIGENEIAKEEMEEKLELMPQSLQLADH